MKKVLAIGGMIFFLWGNWGERRSAAVASTGQPLTGVIVTIGRFDPSMADTLPLDNSVDPSPTVTPNPAPSMNPTGAGATPTPSGTASPLPQIPNSTGQSPAPTTATPAPVIIPSVLREVPNNPLAAPQNIEDLLKMRMNEDLWQAMYAACKNLINLTQSKKSLRCTF